MKKINIYLAGGMEGISYDDSCSWRVDIANKLHHWCHVFNPWDHVSDFKEFAMEDREAMDYDIYQLLHSDIMIMNINNKFSVGTNAEMGIAYTHKIPILSIHENTTEELHPWQKCMSTKIFKNIDDVVSYIAQHYVDP